MIPQEIKEKIFALYWGQNVIGRDYSTLLLPNKHFKLWNEEVNYLFLTPLSAITDEDAIEVAKICGFDFKTVYRSSSEVCISRSKSQVSRTYNRELIRIGFDGWVEYDDMIPYEGSCGSVPVAVFDYLRSKGYALSAYGYSVEQLVEEGIFKLKEG